MSTVEDRLAEIEALADATTAGPWWREGDNELVYGMVPGGRPNGEGIAEARYYGHQHERGAADAAFIAHARTDVPELVAALRAVLAVCEVDAWTARDGISEWTVVDASDVIAAMTAALDVTPRVT